MPTDCSPSPVSMAARFLCSSRRDLCTSAASARPLLGAPSSRTATATLLPAPLFRAPPGTLGPDQNQTSSRSSGISSLSVAAPTNWFRSQRPRVPSAGRGTGRVSVRAERMESKEMSLSTRAPAFELPEPLTGKTWKLDDFEDHQGLLVMFICNHCPFVIHLKESLASFAREYERKGLGAVAISSNSVVTHPQDGPTYIAEDAKNYGYTFPYLYDETQEVAKAYGAVCTPEFFLFRKDGRKPFELAYHGRFDETRPRTNATPTGRDLKAAADALLSGQPIPSNQKPSIGCSIKWHPSK